MQTLVNYISGTLAEKILSFRSLSGGSISSAYRVETESRQYFLLVHLNLFGSSYYSSVAAILKRYF